MCWASVGPSLENKLQLGTLSAGTWVGMLVLILFFSDLHFENQFEFSFCACQARIAINTSLLH